MNITALTAAATPGATEGPGVAGLGDAPLRALPRAWARVLALPLIAVPEAMAL